MLLSLKTGIEVKKKKIRRQTTIKQSENDFAQNISHNQNAEACKKHYVEDIIGGEENQTVWQNSWKLSTTHFAQDLQNEPPAVSWPDGS